jgi:hypothetical protein
MTTFEEARAERTLAESLFIEAGFTVSGGGMMVLGDTGEWDVFIEDPEAHGTERQFSDLDAVRLYVKAEYAPPLCECGKRAFVDDSGDWWVCRNDSCPGVGQVLRPVGFGPLVVITADGSTAQGYLGRDDVLRLAPVREAK